MTCATCGLQRQWHGSDHGRPGTHLAETGCHDGVMMDDDEHAEGWQRDVIYPPCPKNPDRCRSCNGSGEAGPEVTTQDDCPACNGTGWKDGKARWPTPAALPPSTRVLARMHRAHQRGTGCRLSAEDLDALATELAGQWMTDAAEKVRADKADAARAALQKEEEGR